MRTGKPSFLRSHRRAEFHDYLDLVTTRYGRRGSAFLFVQIGAFDGVSGDPLHKLVQRHGWRGVLVEPQTRVFQVLKSNYATQPQLQFFNVAIGDRDGEVTLYTRSSADVEPASTRRHLLLTPGHRKDVIAQVVPCWTVETLLANAGIDEQLDLLQIDAEGSDHKIIHSVNYERIRPTIIRFEHSKMSHREKNDCLALLAGHGYEFIVEEFDTIALSADRDR